MTTEWIKEMDMDQLPDGVCQQIADAIGIANLIALAEIVGGSKVYIPKADSLLQPVRDKHIKREFNGFNHLALAKKYNLSETHVRRLCGIGNIEGQVTFF